MIVTINNETWALKAKKEPKVSEGTRLIMMAAMSFAGGNIFGSSNHLKGINVVAEYRLIRSKTSKLPKAKRDMVVAKFESDFKLLPDDLNFLKDATPQH